MVTVGLPSARRRDEQRKSARRPSWPPGKPPKPQLAKPNVRRGRRPRQNGLPSRRREKRRKPLSGRRSSPHAEKAGKRRSAADVKDRDRRPSFGENSSEPTRDSAHAPDRLHQRFVLVRPILLFTQHGNALLAFLLGSNKTHDAIDSDSVAPLVEAFDYDCSFAGFHGESMHVKS